jgi:exopolysaccharide biosynthesis protein
MDLLVIDKNGDLTALPKCTRAQYNDYLDAHESEMYNVFCFGPVLAENGASVIPENYQNGSVGAQNSTQRSAIAQLGPLEYMIITCNGPQTSGNKGMTIPEFAAVCELSGKKLNENGCLLAFNLDGGNSATMIFHDDYYQTYRTRDNERAQSDIVYFATSVDPAAWSDAQ